MKETRFPPIDRELVETVWPTVVEQTEMLSRLTDEQFQQAVHDGVRAWGPDVARGGAVRVTETTIPSADRTEELPVLILMPANPAARFPASTTPPMAARWRRAASWRSPTATPSGLRISASGSSASPPASGRLILTPLRSRTRSRGSYGSPTTLMSWALTRRA